MKSNRSSKLTARQLKFCEEYQLTLNATLAAIRAGYSEKTANRIASENLSKPVIQNKIAELQKLTREKAEITKQEIMDELGAILRANISDYMKFDGKKIEFKSFSELSEHQLKAIEGIKQGRNGIELKLHGKSWSIDRICKLLGYDAAHDIFISLEKLDESVLDAMIERLMTKNK
ncbi:MAG: terminase small subunit [Prolixibacteraceae bacterium]